MDRGAKKLAIRKGKQKLKCPSLKESDRSRRQWTEDEEKLLMELVEQLVTMGWKTENGFKPGYHKRLQTMMLKVVPDTDLRASPHINSKITQWKRAYGLIRSLIDLTSGVGFNTKTGLIDCTGEQWAKAVQRDPSLNNMRFKAWPFYRQWIELFGDDRATEKKAEDIFNMFTKIVEEDKQNGSTDVEFEGDEDYPTDEYDPSGSSPTEDDSAMESDTQEAPPVDPTPPLQAATPSRFKKKSTCTSSVTNNDPIDGLVECINMLVTSSDERLGTLCEVMSYDSDKGKARREIFNMLNHIPNISNLDKINVSRILAKNSHCMEMFMGFPPEIQYDYVAGLLSGQFAEDA